jgi:hypothetical protein
MAETTSQIDLRSQKIVTMANREKSKAQNFLSLYQQVADLMYPVENQITDFKTPGEDKSLDFRDPAGMIGLDKATSGFISAWIPKDREFFGIRIKNRQIAELDHIKRWTHLAVQIAHDELFESNFMQQLQQTVKATIGFGIGSLFSEFSLKKLALNFKDRHISNYVIKQDVDGRVNTHILFLDLTAAQAAEEFPYPGEDIIKDANNLEREGKIHRFIQIIRERTNRNADLVTISNSPFESVVVNVRDKRVVDEGGYREFPYAVPRWERSSNEKYGRGRGTIGLSLVKELQQMRIDFLECGNKWNNPPLETVDANIEGEIDTSPGGRTSVMEKGSVNTIPPAAMGSFPITREILEMQRDLIKNEIFYNDIFQQFRNLRGDRRVTLELQLRYEEGLDEMVAPVINMESELFDPMLTRVVLLLIRHGKIPKPPAELSGMPFGIEYKGKLAMAMKQYQSQAILKFSQILPSIDAAYPGAKDTINMDRAMPDIAMSMGIKSEHLSTPEEIAAIRQKREADLQQLRMLQAAQVAGQAYKNTTKAAEDDSAAKQVMESVGV